MKTVVISLLGTTMDNAKPSERWSRWRPTLSLFQHDDLVVDRLELIHTTKGKQLASIVSRDIAQLSPESSVVQSVIDWDDPWDFEEVYGKLLDFCRAYEFNNDEERYLVHLTTGTHVAQICWFLLAESRNLPGALIQTAPRGRKNISVGEYKIIDLDLSRYDSIAARFQQQAEEGLAFLKGGINTRNAKFNAMIEEIERVAINSRSPILIMGPTGSGKTQLAKRIYALKRARRQVKGQLVSVNCGTLRGDAAMAALFGHTKGAFTGANVERAGLLKSADGGIVFLDEIGELGLDEQAMLLHAIEEKRFRPMGADTETESDFQLIAGTNRDLSESVAEGAFRSDLLARINLWTYALPGLAERREDVEPNVEFECRRFEEEHGRKVRFNKEAYRVYLDFAQSSESKWAGNFRDLSSSITRMATLAGSRRINEDVVRRELERLREQWRAESAVDDALAGLLTAKQLEEIDLFDQVSLRETVNICRECETLSDAGRRLFQVSRLRKASANDANRLKKYLERFGLNWRLVKS
ncbi:RNA repair transcriptional activator RtcR [Cerasicoccus maritimus]|uniref:RNA repair transcriptional activator RtcR n=1 Tax=Cerasicoccus maritimus TaxID=490089 RepID=UPI002852CE2D|nr:RNA repair transcriptional activator RtcR [Cerasicoccus maritimus]